MEFGFLVRWWSDTHVHEHAHKSYDHRRARHQTPSRKHPEVWAVLGWMCSYWLTGRWPTVRHDQVSFAKSPFRGDRQRSAKAGQSMKVRGILIDFRGDWCWYKQVFGVQGWRGGPSTAKICYRCPCTVADLPKFDLFANWRRDLYTPKRYLELARLGDGDLDFSPMAIPGFTWTYLRPGMMHAGCLGVAQEACGNILWELFRELGGVRSQPLEARCACQYECHDRG
eukprot:5932781-Pyramimonas_sp.AAC.2